jgi:DNA-binding transcriptional regulator YhcF (GntR family)
MQQTPPGHEGASTHPARDRALAFLRHVTKECAHAGQRYLPTIDELAAGAGVSRMVMWHALGRLRTDGDLESGRGRRIRVSRGAPYPSPVVLTSTGGRRWARLAASLEHAILSGTWQAGEQLPSHKDLLGRYGANYRTVRRALQLLVERRVVECHGGHYRVPPRSGSHLRGETVVLVTAGLNGVPVLPAARSHDHIRLLESECARCGLRLTVVTPDSFAAMPEPVVMDGDSVRWFQRDPPLGVLLWYLAFPPAHFVKITGFLRDLRLPVAILDEMGDAASQIGPHPWPQMRTFTMAVSPLAGEEVGRYLLSLGHRRIAFVSTRHSWQRGHSVWRLAGLRSVYAAAGLPDGVRDFTTGEDDFLGDLVAFSRLVQAAGDSILAAGSALPADIFRSAGGLVDALRTHLHREVEVQTPWHSLRALLDRAAAEPQVTAWVGDADATALACLDYLRSRGVRVPEDISVVGFDDGMGALLRNMTSYNFNGSGVMQAMVAHVLTSPQKRSAGPAQPRPTELPGRVVERGTTAKAG